MTQVAILIPLYNGIEFLQECVHSLSRQTYTNWEAWIGINGHGYTGGEVAKTAREICSYDGRFHLIIQDEQIKGKVASLNHLMTMIPSRVEWISLLDADDYWENNKLERQMYALQTDASTADVIGTWCNIFGDRDTSPDLPGGIISADLLEIYNPIINSSALIRRKWALWEYNDMCYGMEDYYLWMKIVLDKGVLYNVPEKLTWHRVYSSSAFNSKEYSNDVLRGWFQTSLRSLTTT